MRRWRSATAGGHEVAVYGVVKFRCRPASIAHSSATEAARSESSMKTIALTAETVFRVTQLRMHSVVWTSRPQSSAFTMRNPVRDLASTHLPAELPFI
jgi:hypothetical protein